MLNNSKLIKWIITIGTAALVLGNSYGPIFVDQTITQITTEIIFATIAIYSLIVFFSRLFSSTSKGDNFSAQSCAGRCWIYEVIFIFLSLWWRIFLFAEISFYGGKLLLPPHSGAPTGRDYEYGLLIFLLGPAAYLIVLWGFQFIVSKATSSLRSKLNLDPVLSKKFDRIYWVLIFSVCLITGSIFFLFVRPEYLAPELVGSPHQTKEEVDSWRAPADQGDASAQFKLGMAYYNGDAVQGGYRYYTEAVKWWRKSADQGYAAAQLALGNAYHRGYGVPRDDAQAITWWQKAANQGNTEAIKILEANNPQK